MRADADALARQNTNIPRHREARNVLEAVIHAGVPVDFGEDGAAKHMDGSGGATEHIPQWSNWKSYIAKHQYMPEILQYAVVSVTAEFIDGTSDPNRNMQPRCDFVLNLTDGCFWRLHPGSKSKQDAKPLRVVPQDFCARVLQSTEPMAFTATDLWRPHFALPFTARHATSVPQTDSIGKNRIWAWVLSLGAAEHMFDVTDGTQFRWWLWVATLEHSHNVVGAGISSAEIHTNGISWADFIFNRIDGSGCFVTLLARSSGVKLTVRANT